MVKGVNLNKVTGFFSTGVKIVKDGAKKFGVKAGELLEPLRQDSVVRSAKKSGQAVLREQNAIIKEQMKEVRNSTKGLYTKYIKNRIEPLLNTVKNIGKRISEKAKKIKASISNYFNEAKINSKSIEDQRALKNQKISELKAKQAEVKFTAEDNVRIAKENAKYQKAQVKTKKVKHKAGENSRYNESNFKKLEAEYTVKDNERIKKENTKNEAMQARELKIAHNKKQAEYKKIDFKKMQEEAVADNSKKLNQTTRKIDDLSKQIKSLQYQKRLLQKKAAPLTEKANRYNKVAEFEKNLNRVKPDSLEDKLLTHL